MLVALWLATSLAARPLQGAQPIHPALRFGRDTILVGRDRVVFLDRSARDSSHLATGFALVRGTRRWVPVRRRVTAAKPEMRVPYLDRDVADSAAILSLGDGLTLRITGDTSSRADGLMPRPVYGVRVAGDGRVYPLVVERDSAARRALDDTPGDDYLPPFSTELSVVARSADRLWFGLWGGVPWFEEEARADWDHEALGGLLEFDRQRRRVTSLIHPALAYSVVRAIAPTEEALWIATDRPDGTLLRYDRRDSTWASFHPDSARREGWTITALARDADRLWFAADNGLGSFDIRTRRWELQYYDTTMRGDSVMRVLSATAPVPDEVRSATLAVATMLGEPRREGLVAAARRAPREAVTAILDCQPECPGDDASERRAERLYRAAMTLGDTIFLPYLGAALRRTDENASAVAIEALLRIDDPRARALLQAVLDSGPLEQGVQITRGRIDAGDTTAIGWLREQLRSPRLRDDTAGGARQYRFEDDDPVLRLVIALEDAGSVPLLFPLLRTNWWAPSLRLIAAVAPLDDRRRMAREALSRPWMWSDLLLAMREDSAALQDPLTARLLLDVARLSLVLPDSSLVRAGVPMDGTTLWALHNQAAGIVVLLRPPEGPAFLIEWLGRPQTNYLTAMAALITLTGMSGAPAASLGVREDQATPAERAQAYRFWTDWWKANATTFRPVRREEGAAAYETWRARRASRGRG